MGKAISTTPPELQKWIVQAILPRKKRHPLQINRGKVGKQEDILYWQIRTSQVSSKKKKMKDVFKTAARSI